MMNDHSLPKFLVTLLFLTALALPAIAQASQSVVPTSTDNKPLVDTALLDDAIAKIPSLRNEENQIRLLTKAATLWWDKDEARARELFLQVQNLLLQLRQTSAAVTLQQAEETAALDAGEYCTLRGEFVRTLARYDPRAAWDFLAASRVTPSQYKSAAQIAEEDQQWESFILPQLAKADPRLALQKALEQLAQDNQADVTPTIRLLMGKDKDAAAQLTRAMLKNLQATNGKEAERCYEVATNLFMTIIQPDRAASSKTAPPAMDEAVLRAAAEVVGQNALAMVNDLAQERSGMGFFLMLILSHVPDQLAQYAPAIMRQLNAKQAEWLRRATPEERQQYEALQAERKLMEMPVQSLLAAAQKEAPEQALRTLSLAAQKAAQEGNIKQAEQIQNDIWERFHPDQSLHQRHPFLAQPRLQDKKENSELTLRQAVEQAPSRAEKVRALIKWAEYDCAQGSKEAAQQRLDEASALLGNRLHNRNQLLAQLRLAREYAGVNPARGFALLEQTTERLNELIEAMATLGGFSYSRQFRQEEMLIISELHLPPLGDVLSEYVYALTALARANKERTQSTIAQLRRPEVQLIITLAWIEHSRGTMATDSLARPPLR